MSANSYIQVIVPLKLDWEPFYSVPEGLELVEGDRVNVLFSGKEYMAVVSKTNAVPDDALLNKGVHSIIDKVADLPRITALEIHFWRTLAAYYLCTVGEVYKSVYFLDKKPPRKWVAENCEVPAVSKGHTSLVLSPVGEDRTDYYLSKAAETLKEGKSVLYLVPEIALTWQLEQRVKDVFPDLLLYHSGITPAKRRDVILEARTGKPIIVLGTRSALFIPFKYLGLIIVDQEQDVSYKQDSPAPRYHARETAIMLGSLCGANVILGSSTPSLESSYNADNGLFTKIELKDNFTTAPSPSVTVIDTVAERRKNGMVGDLSLKLLARIKEVTDAGGKVLLIGWPQAEEMPGVSLVSPSAVRNMPVTGYDLIAVIQADGLLGRQDFRSDERALQLLRRLSAAAPLVIQTRESKHPVFNLDIYPQMLEERRQFGYPPFTRGVTVQVNDINQDRQTLRSRLLGNRIKETLRPYSDPLILGPEQGEIRIFFKRDKQLTNGKQALYKAVTSFEQQYSYSGHITIDVDPV